MTYPRTVRYSTIVRLIFPAVLTVLLFTIFTVVMFDLVITCTSQALMLKGSPGKKYDRPASEHQSSNIENEPILIKTLLHTTKYLKEANQKLNNQVKVCADELSERLGQSHQQPNISPYVIHLIHETNPSLRVTIDGDFFKYLASNLRDTPYPGVENYTQYAVARLGLSPLVDVAPLIPEFGPVINDVHSFPYPISIPPCRQQDHPIGTNQNVFVAVISAPDNFDRRNIIRQTWKNHLTQMNQSGLLGIAGFAFVLGLTEDMKTQKQIEEEAETHGDIIQIGMRDFYRNLSLKGIALLNWVNSNCAGKIDFFVKVDDDVYVNVRNLAHFVQTHDPAHDYKSGKSVFGVGKPRFGWPDRDDKWEMSFEEWPWNQYPPYILGAMVIISGKSIMPLLAASQTTPIMPMEDVYFYGICTKKAGIENNYATTRSLISSIIRAPTTCELRNLIAWRVDFHEFTKLQNIMHSSHKIVDDFYRNATRCAISSDDTNGDDKPID